MANPRRNSESTSSYSQSFSSPSSILPMLNKPYTFPLLLSIFILLTWVFLRIQSSSYFAPVVTHSHGKWSVEGDPQANLVRYLSVQLAKDKRGWLLDPVAAARKAAITGGAVTCVSVHVGEIRPGGVRGNHRHHSCNETFVIWGARTKYRVENSRLKKGYAEAIISEYEVAVAASPSGTAHLLINVDSVRTTFFLGCQDSSLSTNTSNTDYNVWKHF